MSERPEATHHDPVQQPDSGVTDAVTPEPGAADPVDQSAGAEPSNTEAVNDPNGAGAASPAEAAGDSPEAAADSTGPATGSTTDTAVDEHPDTRLAAERLEDLQRLQAEYVNYKRRVDRDRALVQERAINDVLDTLLPVLDDIHAAREHGALTDGPFAAIAEKLETSLGKFGLERFGALGETFDPTVHEALMHGEWDGTVTPQDPQATTIVMVLQPGYRAGERVIRPARVSVADPS